MRRYRRSAWRSGIVRPGSGGRDRGTARRGRWSPAVPSGVTAGRRSDVGLVRLDDRVRDARARRYNGEHAGSLFGNQWNGTSLSLRTGADPDRLRSHSADLEATGMDCVSDDLVHRRRGPPTWDSDGDALQRVVERDRRGHSSTTPLPPVRGDRQLPRLRLVRRCLVLPGRRARSTATHSQNLIETWNGSHVDDRRRTSPTRRRPRAKGSTAVDCFSQTTCSAVGSAKRRLGLFAGEPGPRVERHVVVDRAEHAEPGHAADHPGRRVLRHRLGLRRRGLLPEPRARRRCALRHVRPDQPVGLPLRGLRRRDLRLRGGRAVPGLDGRHAAEQARRRHGRHARRRRLRPGGLRRRHLQLSARPSSTAARAA